MSADRGPKLTRAESGELGIMKRLTTESWDAMTAAARNSPNHVAGMDRWLRTAKEANPTLSDEQAARLAGKLRTEHYRRMGRLSAESRARGRKATA